MKNKRAKVSQELRDQIIVELQDPGCDLVGLEKNTNWPVQHY